LSELKNIPALIVIAGPTASGKTPLALKLARELRSKGKESEIVCADSVTVYRGFDLGSAKPSLDEQKEFRHHLLNVASPTEEFTGGDFIRHAIPAIAGIQARGALPLIVGGTGFYLRALLRGMASNEEEDPVLAAAIKERLTKRAELEGYGVLYKEMLRLDPGSAATVHVNDHYRVIRALQAMELFKKPWSQLNRAARQAPWRFPGTRFFCLEVQNLLASGVPASAKPLLSVGYKECLETLSGQEPAETLSERISASTRRLAKAQRTWFKSEQGVEMLRGPDFWAELNAKLSLSN
jgi:tRNA dimethylallyltransferase